MLAVRGHQGRFGPTSGDHRKEIGQKRQQVRGNLLAIAAFLHQHIGQLRPPQPQTPSQYQTRRSQAQQYLTDEQARFAPPRKEVEQTRGQPEQKHRDQRVAHHPDRHKKPAFFRGPSAGDQRIDGYETSGIGRAASSHDADLASQPTSSTLSILSIHSAQLDSGCAALYNTLPIIESFW